MAFWSRLTTVETWPEIESAAEQRFWDGLALVTSGGRGETGAVYLFGYVVEMLLKTAYFRVRGVARHADTSTERRHARRLAAGYGRRNDHDLNYWVFVLERMRDVSGRPLDPAVSGAIRFRVGIVADHWNESLRYRDAQPTEDEIHDVLRNVEWIREHYKDMWR